MGTQTEERESSRHGNGHAEAGRDPAIRPPTPMEKMQGQIESLNAMLLASNEATARAGSEVGMLIDERGEHVAELKDRGKHIYGLEKLVEKLQHRIRNQRTQNRHMHKLWSAVCVGRSGRAVL